MGFLRRFTLRSSGAWLMTCSFALMATGFTALVGWVMRLPVLFVPVPGAPPLHFATASAFVGMGLSLWCILRRESIAAVGYASLPALVGAYSLALDVGWRGTLWNQIGEWLWQGVPPFEVAHVSEATAGILLLCVPVLWVMALGKARPWEIVATGMLGAFVAASGSLCLLGYSAGSPLDSAWLGAAPMSPLAGLMFLIFGAGVLMHARKVSVERLQAEPRWLPWAVFAIGLIGSAGLYSSMKVREHDLLASMVQSTVQVQANVLRGSLENRVKGLERMGASWAAGAYPSQAAWATEAMLRAKSYGDEFGFSVVFPDQDVAWTTGDVSRMAKVRAARSVLAGHDLHLSTVATNSAGAQVNLNLGIDLSLLMMRLLELTGAGANVKLEVVESRPPDVPPDFWSSQPQFAGVDVAGLRFYVRGTPSPEFLRSGRSNLADQTLFGGLLISFLAGLLIRSMGRNAQARKVAEEATRSMADEMRLRASAEQELSDLYENAACGLHSLDKDKNILRMNATELAWLGYSRDEIVGKMSFDQLLTPESRAKMLEAFPVFMRGQQVREVELDLLRKDGSILSVSLTATALLDAQGKFLRSRSMLVDLTERRRVEQQLKDSKERLDSTLCGANVGLISLDLDGDGLELSPTGKAQLGLADAELPPGRPAWESRIHADDLAAVRETLRSYQIRPWPNFEVEFRALHKSGNYRNLMVRGNARRVDGTSLLMGVVIDLTHRRAAEERFRNVLEAAPEAMVITDLEGKITLVNAQMESLFGYGRGELIGRPIEMLMPAEVRRRHEGYRQTYARNPTPRPMGTGRELTGVRKDGVEVPVEVALSPATAAGVPTIIAAVRDITAKKEAERQLREAKLNAEAANSAKSAFLAHMSHEIRTPLGIILGHAEMLSGRDQTTDESSTSLRYIRKSAENLLVLINDVLDLAKVESGAISIERQRFALRPFLLEVMASIGIKATEKGLAFTWNADPNLPETIDSDAGRLRQILFNVINNAIKFTAKGAIDVKVKLTASTEAGAKPRLEFLVTDTGCGIRAESQEKIFQPFTQAEAYVRRTYGGTGLGLSLSKRLASQLGGDLRLVASEPGRGSTFSLVLDFDASELPTEAAPTSPPARAGATAAPSPSAATERLKLAGVSILLVEDFEDNQVLYGALLRSRGARVVVAGDGRAGCDQALGGGFDVVLMDIQMPVSNGYEAIAELRAKGYRKPVIALTAHAMKGEAELCLEAGFDHYLTKPVPSGMLMQTVAAFAGKSSELSAPAAERSKTRTNQSL